VLVREFSGKVSLNGCQMFLSWDSASFISVFWNADSIEYEATPVAPQSITVLVHSLME
jgi:hypothetical protein